MRIKYNLAKKQAEAIQTMKYKGAAKEQGRMKEKRTTIELSELRRL
jgi:hypothetical protein